MAVKIILERFAYSPDGTFGRMKMPNGEVFNTVERPWLDNKKSISCIPEGIYTLKKRRSGVVERTSGGKFLEGWEVAEVPNRTFIMIHPANWPSDLEGCIGVGKDYVIINNKNAVNNSREVFSQFMSMLDGYDEVVLEIKQYIP